MRKEAIFLGFDVSTTAFAVGVIDADGRNEDFVFIPMEGGTEWNDQPAFDLSYLPSMMRKVLEKLSQNGWVFGPKKGRLSLSVRQHDMVLLDGQNEIVIPALSWQCDVAKKETDELTNQGAAITVGRIEERFILPKLKWALDQDRSLKSKIRRVMTTGDYIAYMLTGLARLSTSDALSNGLLNQATKKLAKKVLGKAGFNTEWFPLVIQSGELIGTVSDARSCSWDQVNSILKGWQVITSLGDNHATAVGCGLKSKNAIVVSGGTSGTINRLSARKWKLSGKAACFEFYRQRLLLMMLADCGAWWDRFTKEFCAGHKMAELDRLAYAFTGLKRVKQLKVQKKWIEDYPMDFNKLSLTNKVASTQASIVIELLILVKKMLVEVISPSPQIARLVLVGGLSRSIFFRHAFLLGLRSFAPDIDLYVNSHQGPLAFKAASLGALINAIPKGDVDNEAIIAKFCSTKKEEEPSFDIARRNTLRNFLRDSLA